MAETKDPMHRLLVWAALATFVFVVGAVAYQHLTGEDDGGSMEYRRANLRLEDGLFREALTGFETALRNQPDHAPSHLGRALALMQMGLDQEALQAFDATIKMAPDFAAAYANRGILRDRLGRHAEALADYREALKLEPDLGDGPDWVTRFFRLQAERPPTIATRADFIESELKKPPGERVLRQPEADSKQRSYKFEGILGDKY